MPPNSKYFYKACFKPDSLNVFEGFDTGVSRGLALGYAQTWHKGCVEWSKYAVYNEFIAGEIGRFLRLPIPPFAITYYETEGGPKPLFSSLDFNFSRAKLPNVIPQTCVEFLPDLCAGVVAFDILIANEDRHDTNALVDNVLKPKAMHLFDHEQSLLGGAKVDGIDRLKTLNGRLGITGGTITGGNTHIFLKLLKTSKHLLQWVDRIRDIPEWFIENVCAEAKSHGLSKKLSVGCAEFLIERRLKLKNLIQDHRTEFTFGDWPAQRTLEI